MRISDVLLTGFEEIKTLQQYLYMSEEHYVEIVNSIGVHLRIRMNENLSYFCKNMNFPTIPESCWNSDMDNRTMLSIIEQLKTVPATEYPDRFSSRWEEIKEITLMNAALTDTYRRRVM